MLIVRALCRQSYFGIKMVAKMAKKHAVAVDRVQKRKACRGSLPFCIITPLGLRLDHVRLIHFNLSLPHDHQEGTYRKKER